MARPARMRLIYPLGGVNKGGAVQNQAPFTTPSAKNVWPDALGRERGGSRPGLARAFTSELAAPIRGLNNVTYINASGVPTTKVVAIAGTNLYYEDSATTLGGTVPTAIQTTKLIQTAEYLQKLYIADHSDDTTLSSSTNFAKIFDPLNPGAALTGLTATDGTAPTGCPVICVWRDRLMLGGGSTTPFGVFGSRLGEPLDWDYSEATDDTASAFSLVLADAGQMGDYVTSMTPHADNCLFIGCRNSLWACLGDPNFGGQVANISPQIGVLDRNAWCVTADGRFVFLSHDGLYEMPAGCGISKPKQVSRGPLPEELQNIAARGEASSNYAVSMAYDQKQRGVYIFLTSRASANNSVSGTHWFFHWPTRSFWPVVFGDLSGAGFEPYTCYVRRNHYEPQVLLGCRDGVVRYFEVDDSYDDEDETGEEKFISSVTLGPFADAGLDQDVRINELAFLLAQDSGDVTWEIFGGNTAEAALENAEAGIALAAGTIVGGRSRRFHPRRRAPVLYLKLTGKDTRWAYEAASMVLAKCGKTRV